MSLWVGCSLGLPSIYFTLISRWSRSCILSSTLRFSLDTLTLILLAPPRVKLPPLPPAYDPVAPITLECVFFSSWLDSRDGCPAGPLSRTFMLKIPSCEIFLCFLFGLIIEAISSSEKQESAASHLLLMPVILLIVVFIVLVICWFLVFFLQFWFNPRSYKNAAALFALPTVLSLIATFY